MELTPSCYTCFLEQASATCDIVDASDDVKQDVLKEVCRILSEADCALTPPPQVSDNVYAAIRRITGVDDPYYTIKKDYGSAAAELLPNVMHRCNAIAPPLEAHVRAALFGNVIDFGCNCVPDIDAALDRMVAWDVPQRSIEQFHSDLTNATSLLYLTDNCGEIVFDAALITHIVANYDISSVTVAVKGGPWINDAMGDDARNAGICDIPGVSLMRIFNGDSGTGYERASPAFRDACSAHDVIVSKGQANWEMLETHHGIYFMLMIKCQEIGKKLALQKGDIGFYKS